MRIEDDHQKAPSPTNLPLTPEGELSRGERKGHMPRISRLVQESSPTYWTFAHSASSRTSPVPGQQRLGAKISAHSATRYVSTQAFICQKIIKLTQRKVEPMFRRLVDVNLTSFLWYYGSRGDRVGNHDAPSLANFLDLTTISVPTRVFTTLSKPCLPEQCVSSPLPPGKG